MIARKRRRWTIAVLATMGVALAGCSSSGGSGSRDEFSFHSATTLGQVIAVADRQPAEAVTGKLLNGTAIDVTGRTGHVVVINFWAVWCPPCRIETPQFDQVYRAYRGKGVDFIGVDTKDSPLQRTKAFVAQYKISYPMTYDEPGRTALTLGNVPTLGLPFTILIDREDRVAAVYVGATSATELRAGLNTLLAEPQKS